MQRWLLALLTLASLALFADMVDARPRHHHHSSSSHSNHGIPVKPQGRIGVQEEERPPELNEDSEADAVLNGSSSPRSLGGFSPTRTNTDSAPAYDAPTYVPSSDWSTSSDRSSGVLGRWVILWIVALVIALCRAVMKAEQAEPNDPTGSAPKADQTPSGS